MVRQIFKGKVIAAAGPLPGQLTVENLRKWTAARKGRFSEEMDDSVTHLLCTEDQFNRKAPMGSLPDFIAGSGSLSEKYPPPQFPSFMVSITSSFPRVCHGSVYC
jgi:hypothetical protein